MNEHKTTNFAGSSRNTHRSLWLLTFASMVMMLLMATEALAGTALQTYWPLAAGDTTTFHYGTKTLTLNVSSAGPNQYKVQSTSASTSANGFEIHQVTEDKVQILSGEAKGATLSFSPPVDFLTEALVQNGGTTTNTTTVKYNGLSAQATYTVTVGMAGTVTVPAGTFTDCRSLTFSASATTFLGSVNLTAMTAILAPRVGIIKKLADADTGTWAELVSGTVGGVDVTKMQPVPVNGVCGSANGTTVTSAPITDLCTSTSTPASVTGTGPWTWSCYGSNGGTDVSCGAFTPGNAPIQGDCNGDRNVNIAEVQSAINMFLGVNEVRGCVDWDAVGGVTISEVQKVINGFLGL